MIKRKRKREGDFEFSIAKDKQGQIEYGGVSRAATIPWSALLGATSTSPYYVHAIFTSRVRCQLVSLYGSYYIAKQGW